MPLFGIIHHIQHDLHMLTWNHYYHELSCLYHNRVIHVLVTACLLCHNDYCVYIYAKKDNIHIIKVVIFDHSIMHIKAYYYGMMLQVYRMMYDVTAHSLSVEKSPAHTIIEHSNNIIIIIMLISMDISKHYTKKKHSMLISHVCWLVTYWHLKFEWTEYLFFFLCVILVSV